MLLPLMFLQACERNEIVAPSLANAAVTMDLSTSSDWLVVRRSPSITMENRRTGLWLTIDCTDASADGGWAGLYFARDGRQYEGLYGGARTAFFIPDIGLTQDRLVVRSADSLLFVRMEGQAYSDIATSGKVVVDREPIAFNTAILSEPGSLDIDAEGMYYIMLPRKATSLRISYMNGTMVDSLFITPATRRLLRYYDSTVGVRAHPEGFGDWTLTSDVRRLQVDVPDSSQGQETLFELDFDHAYKDFGQFGVHTTIHIDY
jgi:hypothetical protein